MANISTNDDMSKNSNNNRMVPVTNNSQSNHQEVEWHSFPTGLERIQDEAKPAVVDFYASWCYWCQVMERQTFSQPDIVELLRNEFVPIRINTEDNTSKFEYQGNEYSPATFAVAAGVSGLPSIMFMDKEANIVSVIPGFLEPDIFLPLLQYMKKECYNKQMSLDEFMEQEGNCN